MPTLKDLRIALHISAMAKGAGITGAAFQIAHLIAKKQMNATIESYEKDPAADGVRDIANLNGAIDLEERLLMRALPPPMRRKNVAQAATVRCDHSRWDDQLWQSFLASPFLAFGVRWTSQQYSVWKTIRREALQGRKADFGILFPSYSNAGGAYSKISEINLILEKSGSSFRLKWSRGIESRFQWKDITVSLEIME